MNLTWRPPPVLTATAVLAAGVAAVVQYAVPAAVPALQRDPAALADGQWWRLVTPLLVQTLGWYQVVANLTALAMVGLVAEVLLGRRRWLLLFAAGTAGGQVAAYAWHEPGAGDSIAVCGLAAGALVAMLTRPGTPWWPGLLVAVGYVAALTGWGFGGPTGAALSCLAVTALPYPLRCSGVRATGRVMLAGALACAVALLLARDLHGAALVAAASTAAGLAVLDRTRAARRPDGIAA